MTETGPDPTARIAALDQELAALDERLDRHARGIARGDVGAAVAGVVLITLVVIARPAVYWWELVAALAALVLATAGGFVQGLMIRSYRAEIRELRSRVTS